MGSFDADADAEALRSAAAEVEAARSDLEHQLMRVRASVDAVTDGWHGAGAAAFEEAIRLLHADYTRLIGELDTMAGLLRRMDANYVAADTTARESFDRIARSLDRRGPL
ncbi:WXG100 family type VII secretion target [Asanoa sp. WMMD1127]|uniref:WXG100 family type VII secretion target n=1 Tax=Asanoa sp. WMMD1127 TaxID=3016107 RepID=UPI0024175A75|nr:WXG100 family type VII secretion target [Asanoa sp. WMMD1127]MDG4825054.1 WXG100 family type VII secretion target [Asanoa sp. WMMD1127]